MVKENDNCFNSRQAILNDINKIPLLTDEEQVKYAKDLKLITGLDIISKKNSLDLNAIFSNLTDNNAEDVILLLRKMYYDLSLDSLSSEENKVKKYEKEFRSKGRVLSQDELKENGFYSNKKIDEVELLSQVKKYVLYNIAKNKFFHSNLRLIVAPAMYYSARSEIDFLDLFSEGTFGLMKAIEKYDVDKGYRFSTYALWWIKNDIRAYVRNNYSSLKIPANYLTKIKKFVSKVNELEQKTKRQYSIYELADIFHINVRDVYDYLFYDGGVISLNSRITDEDDDSILDLISGEEVDFYEKIDQEDLRKLLEIGLGKMGEDERQIFCLLLGYNEENYKYSIDEICKKLKMPRSKVIEVRQRGLTILRYLSKYDKDVKELKNYLK